MKSKESKTSSAVKGQKKKQISAHPTCTCICRFNLVQVVYNRTLTSFMLIFSGKILQIVAHDADNSQPQAPNSSSPPKPDTDNSQPQACLPLKPTGPQSSAWLSYSVWWSWTARSFWDSIISARTFWDSISATTAVSSPGTVVQLF